MPSPELTVRASIEINGQREVGNGYYRLAPIILFVADYLSVAVGLAAAYYFREYLLRPLFPSLVESTMHVSLAFGMVPLIYIGFICYEGLYTKRQPFWLGAQRMFKACFFANLMIIGIMYFMHVSDHVSRIYFFASWLFIFSLLLIERYTLKRVLAKLGLWQKPIIVIGAGKTAEQLANAYSNDPFFGYYIAGVLDDNENSRPLTKKYPVLGNFSSAAKIIEGCGIQDVVIAAPGLDRAQLIELIYQVQPYVKKLTVIPDLAGMPLANLEAESLFNEKMVMLRIHNNMTILSNRIMKRLFDMVVSLIGIAAVLPLLGVISLLIYLDSPGAVVFSHSRVGQYGKVFKCYKFRSMICNAGEALDKYLSENPEARAEWDRDHKLKDDPRVTRIGAFLRKTSLDELPQFINVLKGEMSLVGPRPIVAAEVPKYKEFINDYYLVPPGITGYWQVSGRNDIDYDSRVQMDSWYVRNWSLWLDIVFLVKTVGVVLARKGAY